MKVLLAIGIAIGLKDKYLTTLTTTSTYDISVAAITTTSTTCFTNVDG